MKNLFVHLFFLRHFQTGMRKLCFHFNMQSSWLCIPILILFWSVQFNGSQCLAQEAPTSFEMDSEMILRVTDPVQTGLMSPVNLVTLEESPVRKKSAITNEKPTKTEESPYRVKVLLDAGHGGKDMGAAGRYGIQEKNISLNLAKKVKRELDRISKLNGYPLEIRLSRDEDVFIPLKERARIANDWGADMFISIHLNSSPVVRARGFEVYFLSPEATDPEAEKLALKESEGSLPTDKADVLSILSDVQTTFHTNESALFAEDMFSAISKQVTSNGRGVRQGPFTVLHGTNMPAILVEVGYLTHPQESLLLTKEAYLKRLASAISSGIIEFGSRTRKLG
ncbi:MAG: N-acetylmuramoyl-L-alanine amidase [Proteobacteria bacterium]|nr:N-acetylmuramoyl-L-alanine amidase [Pseudomonadota bacterium]NDC24896.1 N-acetylmuramoyl-L-alanine amidase [Pseudomonadota bacterium]NDD04779.1 N-acetylmuramoyl-L-alanine amidase [Pseudomonadota bacterium]NDG27319.1 N-acetylmuramoyl-L-alanine amidase [Pseudomonadota bacterium]